MIFTLLLETILIFVLSKFAFKRMVTAYTVVILPYVVIALMNNAIFVNYGFVKVGDKTLWLIMLSSILFFCGVIIVSKVNIVVVRKRLAVQISKEKVFYYSAAVVLIRLAEIVIKIIKGGIANVADNDFASLINTGLTGHLMLSIFPLMPIILYEWIKDKKNVKYIVLYLVYLIICFVETEKAQVIAPVIAGFLYCTYVDEKYIKKGVLTLLAFVVVAFVGNYSTKFLIQGFYSDVPMKYYFYRLWNYIAGGIINTETILDANLTTNALDYLSDVIFAFPNMITNRLFGFTLGANVVSKLPLQNKFLRTTVLADAWGYQDNNVYGTLSLIYGNGNIPLFCFVVILWGCISQLIFNKMRFKNSETGLIVCVCYMTFSFLSFFSSYYTIASFLERILWCLVMSHILRNKYESGKEI